MFAPHYWAVHTLRNAGCTIYNVDNLGRLVVEQGTHRRVFRRVPGHGYSKGEISNFIAFLRAQKTRG